jgi:hypothetical protein
MQTFQPFINLETIKSLNTNELEVFIDTCYEVHVPQEQLELLETLYADRVSEEDLNMTEDEPNVAEAWDMGVDLEEWLAYEYYRYLHPPTEWGGRKKGDFFKPETFNDFLSLHLKPTIKRKDILSAAKDIYERKQGLILRYRSANKINTIPKNLIS